MEEFQHNDEAPYGLTSQNLWYEENFGDLLVT